MKPVASLRPCIEIGGQLQAGNPAFGTSFQRGDVFCRKVQAHHLVEEFGGFGGGKAQVRGAQFGQLAPGAQTGQGQGWILAGGDDQVHLWRQVLEQKGEGVVDAAWSLDQVIVVEDEDDPVGDGGDLVDQGGQDGLGRRRLRGSEARSTRLPLADIPASMVCKAAIR